MPKGTLKKSKATPERRITYFSEGDSSSYKQYLKAVEDLFREHGRDMLAAAGFICYVELERPGLGYCAPRVGEMAKVRMVWIRDIGDLPGMPSQEAVERILQEKYSGIIRATYLKGQRHDYFFYTQVESIETILELIEVAKVMAS